MSQGGTKGVPVDVDGNLASNSDQLVPSQKATKTYVDNAIVVGTAANISGIVTVGHGGTNATTASGARTNLGVAIGSDVQAYSANIPIGSVGITIDGGGVAITTGVKGYIYCPYGGTINSWTVVGDVSGSIVIDVWKIAFAADTLPTVSNTITASDLPTITTSKTGQNTNPSTWTGLTVSAGDVFGFNVNSCTTITKATLTLKITKT